MTQPNAQFLTTDDDEARLVADSGRIVTDRRGIASGRLRSLWQLEAPLPGEIRRLADGGRVLVLSSRVDYATQATIDDLRDAPGWHYTYDYVGVAPTADETEQDVRESERSCLASRTR